MKRTLLISLAVFLILGILFPLSVFSLTDVQAAPNNEKVKVFIGFTKTPGASEQALVRAFGGDIIYSYHIIPAIAAELPEPAIKGLLRRPNVTVIEPVIKAYLVTYQSELDNTWGVKRIGAGLVHTDGFLASGVKVAIIDSGIDYNHPELAGNYRGGYDFADKDNDPMDKNGHGTHVAGTIAALRNGLGVVGAAPGAHLYALKVFGDSSGSASYDDIIAAIEWAAKNGIKITNNSYGSTGNPGTLVEEAFINTYNNGMLHVAAAGNEGNLRGIGDNVIYPARFSSVIAVAASTSSDRRASFSSTGPAVELIAPGASINSTIPGGGYGFKSGTSMASPHVAGVAALVWAASPSLTNVQVRAVLQDTVQDLKLPANHQGKGLVRADLAVAAVAGTITVAVTGVSIDQPNQTIEVEGTVQLNATVSPPDATNKNVSWTSIDEAVATVTDTGLVTGVSAGTATITVTTSDGGFTDAVDITVNATSEIVGVESVSINEEPPTIEEGKTFQLTATVSPGNATNKNVSWSSSHTGIATVDQDGLVTGIASGTATITVITSDGGHQDSIEVTVTEQQSGELKALYVAITNPLSGLSYIWNSWVDIAVKVTDTDQGGSAVAGANVTVTIKSPGGTNLATYNGTSNAEGVFTARYRVPNKAEKGDYTITASASKEGFNSGVVSVIFYVTGR